VTENGHVLQRTATEKPPKPGLTIEIFDECDVVKAKRPNLDE